MDIKDIEVGKTYRYAISLMNTDAETGTVTVEQVDAELYAYPVLGFYTIDGNTNWDGESGMFYPSEIIEEV